jgi:hypothetical protein
LPSGVPGNIAFSDVYRIESRILTQVELLVARRSRDGVKVYGEGMVDDMAERLGWRLQPICDRVMCSFSGPAMAVPE